MKAFHNDPAIKEKYLNRVRAHAAADEIVKGTYWKEGKGCAVGCTIHSNNHNAYEIELGIPEWLARLEDTIFENLPNERAKEWPVEFLSAIKPGADLDKTKAPFLIFVLEFVLDKFDHEKFPDVKKCVDTVIGLYQDGEADLRKFEVAAVVSEGWAEVEAAWAAMRAARTAAWNAAWSAADRAAWAAMRAARTAAGSAAGSAARSAAWSAAWSAERSAAWSAAWSAERSAAYVKFADKLLELLRGLEDGEKNEPR